MLSEQKVDKSIPYNIPYLHGTEATLINELLTGTLDHPQQHCIDVLTEICQTDNILLTGSCSQALEMAVLASGIGLGDEVILPSFTYTSTANAVIAAGGLPVFVDCEKGSMNVLPNHIEAAITNKTKAVIIMHYAGIACDLSAIAAICDKYQLRLIEDAAQCIGAYLDGQHLGTFGDYGTFSFHDTKNVHCYKGGALIYKNPDNARLLNQLLYHGTNRLDFLQGKVDQYTWVSRGSSNYLSDLASSFLLAQLKELSTVNTFRKQIWQQYYQGLSKWAAKDVITLPVVLDQADHNGHIFHFCLNSAEHQKRLIAYLKQRGISAYFHYQPLHKSEAGLQYGRFHGQDINTTKESQSLIRLPLHMHLTQQDVVYILEVLDQFFNGDDA